MFRKLAILASLVGVGQLFYADSSFAMEPDWQKRRIERNIALLQEQLRHAKAGHDEVNASRISKELQEEQLNLHQYLNPRRALPGAVHDPSSHLFEQQYKGDEGLAAWQQNQADKENARLKAERLAEEERQTQIELDRIASEREKPPVPNPATAGDEALAQRFHTEERDRIRRERAEQERAGEEAARQALAEEQESAARIRAAHERAGEEATRRLLAQEREGARAEQERRARENAERERAGEEAARRLQSEEAARRIQPRHDVEYDALIARQMQAEEEANARHNRPAATASDEEIARQLAQEEYEAHG